MNNEPKLPAHPIFTPATIGALVALACISSAILGATHYLVQDTLERRGQEHIRALTLEMLPDAVTHKVFTAHLPSYGDTTIPQPIYAGYDASGTLVGVAIEASDRGGYGGEIRVIYGYLPEEQRITGVKILRENETPDIGGRIRTDPDFLARFDGLDMPLEPRSMRPRHPVRYVAPETNGGPGEIEGLSGATVSARAVVRAVRVSTNRVLPVVHDMLDDLKKGDE